MNSRARPYRTVGSVISAIERAVEVLEECPGEGKCHGCLKWCDECGDVDEVCDGPEHCYQHGCMKCGVLLSHDEHEYAYETGGYPSLCFSCEIRVAMEKAIDAAGDELVAADDCRRKIEKAICKPLPASLPLATAPATSTIL